MNKTLLYVRAAAFNYYSKSVFFILSMNEKAIITIKKRNTSLLTSIK